MTEKDDKIISMNDFKKEAFKRKVRDGFKKAVDTVKKPVVKAINWSFEHPTEALGIATGAGIALTKVAKIHSVNAEDRRRTTDFYDPRTGAHSIAKRALRPKEKVEIIERYKAGESYDEILYDKGLLKK